MKKYFSKTALIDTIIYVVIFIISYFILKAFNLMFREWVYILSTIIVVFGLIVGIIQLIVKLKNKSIKSSLIIIFAIMLIALTPIVYWAFTFVYGPEYVVNKNGKEYVAYVNGFLNTYVNYYDYKNILVVGNRIKIEENYGKGGFDPIENKHEYNYKVESITYYDDNGNIVFTDEENTH